MSQVSQQSTLMNRVNFILLFLSLVALPGCSLLGEPQQAQANKQVMPLNQLAQNSKAKVQPVPAKPKPAQRRTVTLLDRVVWNAKKQQGKMYRWGGTSPVTGFDCSGLTQYSFKKGAKVAIPRTAAQQYKASVKVSRAQAQKGDLVFFNTSKKRYVSHVGIYLGNNKFVHAPRTGRAITTSQLKGYWAKKLIGFGRIPGACKPAFARPAPSIQRAANKT